MNHPFDSRLLNYGQNMTRLQTLLLCAALVTFSFGLNNMHAAPQQKSNSKQKQNGQAAKQKKNSNPKMPPFRVEDGFEAPKSNVKRLLVFTGSELWKYFPDYDIEPFVVRRGDSPIVLFKRNAQREIVMKLGTKKTYWSQYAYQFSHEFCHILCKYDADFPGNKWFEETLCETASLFVLRAMSKSWETNPPYPNWKGYRTALSKYAQDIIDRHSGLDRDSIGDFYRAKAAELRKNATNRKLNAEMAVVLLGLFEEKPERWEAIRWINAKPSQKGESFHEYINNWYIAVPNRHKAFVTSIADMYGIEIESKASDTDAQSQNKK